jgi:hypothetical protein
LTDTPYPPEWNRPPDSLDPITGDGLDPWRPTPADTAAVCELAVAYIAQEPQFCREFLDFAAGRYTNRSWPQAFLCLLDLLNTTAIGGSGRDVALARLTGNREDARTERWQANG